MELQHSNALLKILLTGLTGKTWKGKDKLLKALCSICSNCNKYCCFFPICLIDLLTYNFRETLKNNEEITPTIIIEAACREARKQEITYKLTALECLGELVAALDYDAFEQVYEIIKSVLHSQTEKEEDDEENTKENRENQISLKIIAYETLGESCKIFLVLVC